MDETSALNLFAALSQGTRLAILRSLVAAGPEGLSAGEIASKVGATPSRASFHLATMTETGLVDVEKRSREMRYRVRFETLGALVTYLMEDCCAGSTALRACCPGGHQSCT